MSEPAITVRGIGKRYRLGGPQQQAEHLREALRNLVLSPLRNVRWAWRGATDADTFWALRDVDLDVERGEVLGVIGKNGSGKSTLLKILSRITAPTEGEAVLRGRVGSLLEVGTGFHPELTGRENIYMAGAVLGLTRKEIDERYEQIVAFSEIADFIDTPAKRYSSGMKVRLGFSVAAHLDPEILLVDEVLAVGDAAFRKKCMGAMGEVSQGGRTILFVSHNMAQIRRLCHRAVWLEDGRVRAVGDASDVSVEYEKEATGSETCADGVFVRRTPAHAVAAVREARLTGAHGRPRTHFDYGDEMTVRLRVEWDGEASRHGFTRVALNCLLTDSLDTRISANSMVHEDKEIGPDVTEVVLRIRDLPLYRGDYKLHFGVTHPTQGRLDTWSDAVRFHVVRCDPIGRGHERDQRSGFVHTDMQWETVAHEGTGAGDGEGAT